MHPDQALRTTLQVDVADATHVLDAVASLQLQGVGLLAPAHISLSWPWLSPPEAAAAVPSLAAQLAEVAVTEVTLVGPSTFPPDRAGRRVVHLSPQPDGPLHTLRALACDGQAPSDHPYTPHLSVARVRPDADLESVQRTVALHAPLRARLSVVQLHVEYRSGWRVEARLPLGVASQPRSPGADSPGRRAIG